MTSPIEVLRGRLSVPAKRRIAYGRLSVRLPTSPWRALPRFLIIGAQRCGTSSLYRYLGQHPDVVPSVRKEVEYFSTEFHRGEHWYRAHFPLEAWRRVQSFEATPDYLFHPLAAARAAALVPAARLVIMLRDPVERAYSQHRHMVRIGFESLGFEEAIAREPIRVAGEMDRIREDPSYPARFLMRFGYVARSRYAEQVEEWVRHYPREQMLFVETEDLAADPAGTYRHVVSFLGLRAWEPRTWPNFSSGASSPDDGRAMSEEVRGHLRAELAPHNERLVGLIGRTFRWT